MTQWCATAGLPLILKAFLVKEQSRYYFITFEKPCTYEPIGKHGDSTDKKNSKDKGNIHQTVSDKKVTAWHQRRVLVSWLAYQHSVKLARPYRL